MRFYIKEKGIKFNQGWPWVAKKKGVFYEEAIRKTFHGMNSE